MTSKHAKALYDNLKPTVFALLRNCSDYLRACQRKAKIVNGHDMSNADMPEVAQALVHMITLKHFCALAFGQVTVGQAFTKYHIKVVVNTHTDVKSEKDGTRMPSDFIPKTVQKQIMQKVNQNINLIQNSRYQQARENLVQLKELFKNIKH